MHIAWATVLTTSLSSVGAILSLGYGAWRFYLRDLRQGLVDLRKEVIGLRVAEREESRGVWTEWRGLFELRIAATHEAVGKEEDDERRKYLMSRTQRAQDEYLDLLDRAVKFPDVIDPNLRSNPEYTALLKGQLEAMIPNQPAINDRATATEQIEIEQLIQRVERLSPQSDVPEDYRLIGRAYQRASRYENALVNFNRALAQTPNEPRLLYERSVTLFSLGRYGDALKDYNAAVAGDARLENDYQRGSLLLELERYDEALQLFRQLADNPATQQCRAICLDHLNKRQEALAEYNAAIELEPGDVLYRLNRAALLAKLDREEDAVADLRAALDSRAIHAFRRHSAPRAVDHKYFEPLRANDALRAMFFEVVEPQPRGQPRPGPLIA